MSLQVQGKCQIYKVEDKGKFATGTLRTSKKDTEGNWQSEFFNAKFVGMAGATAKGLADKTKINIIEGALENREWQGKHYISVVVFKYEVVEGANNAGQQDEVYVMTDDSDLPF